MVDFRDRWYKACCSACLGAMYCLQCGEQLANQRLPQCSGCGRRLTTHEQSYRGLMFHDLRRTAARNLRRAGLPESMIKQIGGSKTTSVFHRYAIVNRQDMAAAMRQFEEHKARVGRTSQVETPESEFGHRLGTNDDFQVADTSQKKIQ